MSRTSSTTLKLPTKLKTRLVKLAKKRGDTTHGFMLAALERQADREERMAAFVEEARAADREIDAGGDVFAAAEVHDWLDQLARGEQPNRPKPWRR